MDDLSDILPAGRVAIVRDMDPAIPFERSFVVEASLKTRHPDRSWAYSGLSHVQKPYRPEFERLIDQCRVQVVDVGEGVILGFCATYIRGQVVMLYVKRRFRGRGVGALLCDPMVAEPMAPNECWRRWVAYHKERRAA
jgi:GNAT superfamily N-acetyltransferase